MSEERIEWLVLHSAGTVEKQQPMVLELDRTGVALGRCLGKPSAEDSLGLAEATGRTAEAVGTPTIADNRHTVGLVANVATGNWGCTS